MLLTVCMIGCFIGLCVPAECLPNLPSQRDLPDSVVIRIPGTTVPFEMVLCSAEESLSDDDSEDAIDSLYVLTTEVTWDLYDIYVFELDQPDGTSDADSVSRPSKPYIPPDRGFGHEGYPAIGMTRAAAEGFCDWLSLKTGLEIRLPTPQEWAYLAAGNTSTPYCCEVDEDSLDQIAWFADNAEHTSHPVGQKPANQFGLFDMHGNAAEWVVTDTRKPHAMGGSYLDAAAECTATSTQQQQRSWNVSDPQIPKSQWWLADCTWVGFRFVVSTTGLDEEVLRSLSDE